MKHLGLSLAIGVVLALANTAQAQSVDEATLQQKVTIKPNSPGYEKRQNFPHRWYNVKLTANNSYQIDLIAVDPIDPYLFIELDGQVVASDDDGGGNLNARLIFRPNRTADYKIIATTYNGAAGEAVLVVKQVKNLVAGPKNPNPPDPFEPNPNPTNPGAGGLANLGPAVLSENGAVFAPGGSKTYQLQLQKGKTYQIDCVSTDGQFDPVIELNGPNNRPIAEDDDSGGFPNARLIHRTETAGMYTINVRGFNNSTGNFRLTVRPQN